MSNMSYCRFENTESDFRDCAEAICEIEAGNEAGLSRSELEAAARLMIRARDLVLALSEEAGKDAEDMEEDDFAAVIAEYGIHA